MMKLCFCNSCIYLFDTITEQNRRTCKAFPNGIPGDILLGYEHHSDVKPNQEGEYIFNPIESKREYFMKRGYSFEGFEGESTKAWKLLRAQELKYKLRLPPQEVPFQEDINWVKHQIKDVSTDIYLLMFSPSGYQREVIEKKVLEARYGIMPITLWKPENEYFLIGGYAKAVYNLCQKYNFDFDVQLLHFEGGQGYEHLDKEIEVTILMWKKTYKKQIIFTKEQAVKEWILHQYFTDPDCSESVINEVRAAAKDEVFFD